MWSIGIAYPDKALKKDLCDVIKTEELQDMLLIKWLGAKVCGYGATIAILYLVIMIGHEVVRLPVAHCELNPIEMAWSQVKEHVKRNNKRYGTESI